MKYIAIDGIELDKSFGESMNIHFAETQWKVEDVKLCSGNNFVIKRTIPDITQFDDADALPSELLKSTLMDKHCHGWVSSNCYKKCYLKMTAFLGPAGCGKTHKILELPAQLTLYLGPTNESVQILKANASKRNIENITGMTLYRAFGIGCKKSANFDKYSKIVLDEISMVSLELITRCVKQLIDNNWKGEFYISGDFQQLLPVNGTIMYDIQTKTFAEELIDLVGDIDIVHLTKNWRQQSDTEFYNICQKLRTGDIDRESIDKLNTRVMSESEILAIQKDSLTIAGVNTQVDVINNKYKWEVGAKIMIKKNIPKLNLYNGNTCVIVSLTGYDVIDAQKNGNVSIARSIDGESDVLNTPVNMKLDKLKSISNIAYAMTVHKSQGKTISGKLIINPTRLFAKNHLYVALTRATCLSNIYLTSPIVLCDILGIVEDYDESDWGAIHESDENMTFPWFTKKYQKKVASITIGNNWK